MLTTYPQATAPITIHLLSLLHVDGRDGTGEAVRFFYSMTHELPSIHGCS